MVRFGAFASYLRLAEGLDYVRAGHKKIQNQNKWRQNPSSRSRSPTNNLLRK
jgi:hypothetical protein